MSEIIPKYYEDYHELVELMKKSSHDYNFELVEKAYRFAEEKHGDQRRASGIPYILHPTSVACILAELGMDSESLAAALLHDVVEDTPVTLPEIVSLFGQEIAELIDGVTKLGKIPYSSREEQQAENIRKMLIAMAKDIRVIIIKLADRLHNMRTIECMKEQHRRDKALEVMEVYAPIAHRLGIRAIKEELEDLAIRYLDPVGYAEIERQLEKKSKDRVHFVAEIKQSLYDRLEGEIHNVYISGRVKSIHGIYKKTFMKGNVKIGYEISADGAVVHTEAANSAVTEEQLVLGIVSLIPQSIKKWISISDEVYDLAGEEFLDYIYDELTYRIAKKLADCIIADIEACGTASTGSLPAVPKITATTVTLGLVAQAMAQLSDEAANPVVMMNKQTWGAFKAAQAANGYNYDPFEGLPVVFNDSISAFSAATTGVTYAIVGDLGVGAQANFPNGQEIEIKLDDKTKMEYDLVRILGREFVGHAVVAPKAFCKIVH